MHPPPPPPPPPPQGALPPTNHTTPSGERQGGRGRGLVGADWAVLLSAEAAGKALLCSASLSSSAAQHGTFSRQRQGSQKEVETHKASESQDWTGTMLLVKESPG